ncbi:20938_t:CDS:2, partial [Racocetra persica]
RVEAYETLSQIFKDQNWGKHKKINDEVNHVSEAGKYNIIQKAQCEKGCKKIKLDLAEKKLIADIKMFVKANQL